MALDSYHSIIAEEAAALGVSPEIHQDDFIFRFLFENPVFPSKEDAIKYYFNDGQNSAKKLFEILIATCKFDHLQKIRLLEFASGFGCVTRHLKKTMPQVEITACDIHKEAVDFITKRLAVSAVLSASQPEQLKIKSKYDAVFALSFFSHMPKTSFTRWMKQLLSFTKPGGFLVFTTHGQQSIKFLPNVQFDQSGFGFQPSSEQKDLDTAEYGSACTKPEYVIGQIFSIPGARLITFGEAIWWKHQDLYIIQRID